MAYIPRSSLIPTEASGAIPVQMKRRRTIHAFGLIATIIFVLSLLGAIGVFLYQNYLGKQLESAKTALGSVGNEEDARKIAEIRLYDEKLRIAQNLLDNHVAVSKVFEEIEDSTKETVQFRSLEFVHDPGFEAVLTLTGVTEEFSSVALQKMQILEDTIFSEFVLQDISTEKSSESEDGRVIPGGVSFRVTGVFDREFIKYEDRTEEEEHSAPSVLPVSGVEDASGDGAEGGASAESPSADTPTAPEDAVDAVVPLVVPPQS